MSMKVFTLVAFLAAILVAVPVSADPLNCSLTGYKPIPGLAAVVAADELSVTWDGNPGREVRLRLAIEAGTPVVKQIAVRRSSGAWTIVVSGAAPEFRVASGLRRISNQQLQPLRELGVEITPEIVDRHKWDAFWDAPLDLDQSEPRTGGNPPPAAGVANQPGLPRKPDEVKRATAVYQASSCEVKTNGARLEISFPGLTLGVFSGHLRYTVYRGTNLIRMEAVATTTEPSVAYKYDAGLKGLTVDAGSRVAWRDLAGLWQESRLGGAVNQDAVPLRTANRLIAVEGGGGSLAAFPPPHTFFWAREVETNLGYSWYRKDAAGSFSFGVRQAEQEDEPRYRANFSLYSAPPGTVQRMPVYFYVGEGSAAAAIDAALAFTRGDRYKPLAGYQVMANHFHMDMGARLLESGSLDTRLPDLDALRAAGVTIVSPTDRPNAPDRLEVMHAYFEGGRRHSDGNFLILPAEEVSQLLGGHWDIVFPRPVYWTRDRKEGQAFVEAHPTYGQVYRVGSVADVLELVERENGLIFMPHPRTKGSTGYPDVIKDSVQFGSDRYRGVGWRWGMGLDLSEERLSDKRVLPLLDDMNNWIANLAAPLKHIQAITETYEKKPGDDIYANNPVNYVKIEALPPPGDAGPVIEAIRRGDYFVTSGEVLIPSFTVEGTGAKRTITADVEWTFPLEFVEVVWGDGRTTGRQIVPATEGPAFGRHRFQIPFDASGRAWVRFAAWDSAGNGALVQPVRIQP
jgi:hypothetical protein